MLVIVLLKGVPARTTQVVQVGGVLNRETMDLVLNPHDAKAVEAADYLKRRIGGKVVALSMGPDLKLVPLMKPLYDSEVLGVDEEYVLSDRKMAGSDTLATSYAVALGVKKVVERHLAPIEEIAGAVRKFGYSEAVRARAAELYGANLLPNLVYSELPAVKGSIVQRFLDGKVATDTALRELAEAKEDISRFMVVAGIKTTDGETGSVGPQVAEGVSELMQKVIPHATYVEDFQVNSEGSAIVARRMIGYLSQKIEMSLPALITVSTDYRPETPPASVQLSVRANSYRGKVFQAFRWTAADLGADPSRLGLMGSPTIVGTGIDVGKPPVQKTLGRSLVFLQETAQLEFEGKKYGPFAQGDLVGPLPDGLVAKLRAEGRAGIFDYRLLTQELTA
ncbi:MAG: hypothetical protein JRN06_02795 [Nitrososphaerota archaeon]|nr:hypothetical protein [Nitrososphaerota archaeon]MDG7023215.1 hypothetical protein [Nitrososphaerota archaeon]